MKTLLLSKVKMKLSELVGRVHSRAALEYIQKESEAGKPLKDELESLKSYRVGRFRIIYRISAKAIFI
jgi:mRNA-degrading endonuclease RelE of RelBE toxin-antitoxin system